MFLEIYFLMNMPAHTMCRIFRKLRSTLYFFIVLITVNLPLFSSMMILFFFSFFFPPFFSQVCSWEASEKPRRVVEKDSLLHAPQEHRDWREKETHEEDCGKIPQTGPGTYWYCCTLIITCRMGECVWKWIMFSIYHTFNKFGYRY